MAIQGNYTTANHTDFIANTGLREILNIPDTATHAQMVEYWNSVDSVDVSGGDMTSLSGLGWITDVPRDMRMRRCHDLTDLSDLSNLTRVGGDLDIYNCDDLTNLDGLENVAYVGGELDLSYCYKLENVDALSSLVQVGRTMRIIYNYKLTNLDGLSSLATIMGVFYITGSRELVNLAGLSSLVEVRAISANDCTSLSDLSGIRSDIITDRDSSFNNTGVTTVAGLGYLPDMTMGRPDVGEDNYGRYVLELANYGFLLNQYDYAYPDGQILPEEIDVTPDQFVLNSNTDIIKSSVQDSNVITISGLGTGTSSTVVISSSQEVMVKKNSEAFVVYSSGAFSVVNGDTLQLRMTAPPTLDVTFAATLILGARSSQWTVSTAANSAPQVTGNVPADITITAGATFSVTIPADLFTDVDGHDITVTYPDLPPFLMVSGRVISGTPDLSHIGAYLVNIVGTDELGAQNSASFSLIISVPAVIDESRITDLEASVDALELIDHTHFDPTTNTVVLGEGANADGQEKAVAIGYGSRVTGNVGTAIGNRSTASLGGFAMGNSANAGNLAVAIGNKAKAAGSCLAFGDKTDSGSSTAAKCVAIGASAEAKIGYEIRLGGEVADYDEDGNITKLHGRGFPTVHPNRAGLETLDNELVSKKWVDAEIGAIASVDLQPLEDEIVELKAELNTLNTTTVDVVYDGDVDDYRSGTYIYDEETEVWSNGGDTTQGATLQIDEEDGSSNNPVFVTSNFQPSINRLFNILNNKINTLHP